MITGKQLLQTPYKYYFWFNFQQH